MIILHIAGGDFLIHNIEDAAALLRIFSRAKPVEFAVSENGECFYFDAQDRAKQVDIGIKPGVVLGREEGLRRSK